MLIVGGTSLAVYPAASYVYGFTHGKIVLVNYTETGMDRFADLVIRESLGKVLSAAVE